jgi:hypothetical protein
MQTYVRGKQDNIQHIVMTFSTYTIIQAAYVLIIIFTTFLVRFQRRV